MQRDRIQKATFWASYLDEGIMRVLNKKIRIDKDQELTFEYLDGLTREHGKFFRADNYMEAVGIMHMLKEGIALDTVTRPISHTKLLK